MAKRKSTAPEMPRILDFEDVANILDFLAAQNRDRDSIHNEEYADAVEAGRVALLLQLAEHLRYADYARSDELNEVTAECNRLRAALSAKEVAHG
jgi:hypothetical protein